MIVISLKTILVTSMIALTTFNDITIFYLVSQWHVQVVSKIRGFIDATTTNLGHYTC